MKKPSGGWTENLRPLAHTKEVRKLLAALQEEGGWEGRRTARHIQLRRLDDHSVIEGVPATPSDHRSIANAVANLRRKGATLRHEHERRKGR